MVEEVAAPVTLPLDPPMANIHGQSFDTQIVLLFQSNDFLKLLLRPGQLKCTYGRSVEGSPVRGKVIRLQTANVVVIEQSLGSWSHLWSLSNVSGCGSTSLFGSRAGTHQGKGSVSRFGR